MRPGELNLTVGPNSSSRRMLMAAAGRALTDERNEFGLADLLAAAAEIHNAGATDTDTPQRPE